MIRDADVERGAARSPLFVDFARAAGRFPGGTAWKKQLARQALTNGLLSSPSSATAGEPATLRRWCRVRRVPGNARSACAQSNAGRP